MIIIYEVKRNNTLTFDRFFQSKDFWFLVQAYQMSSHIMSGETKKVAREIWNSKSRQFWPILRQHKLYKVTKLNKPTEFTLPQGLFCKTSQKYNDCGVKQELQANKNTTKVQGIRYQTHKNAKPWWAWPFAGPSVPAAYTSQRLPGVAWINTRWVFHSDTVESGIHNKISPNKVMR